MVNGIIDILVGFIIGIIENSSWFQSLFTNKLYNSLIQGANKKVKDDKTIKKTIKDEIDKANQFIYLYNPETQKIKAELFKVEIGKDNVNLYYRITFITKNLNK